MVIFSHFLALPVTYIVSMAMMLPVAFAAALVALAGAMSPGRINGRQAPADELCEILNPDTEESDFEFDDVPFNIDSLERNAGALATLWPEGIVPYTFHSNFSSEKMRDAVKRAIDDFNEFTCVKIVPRTNEEDYVEISDVEGGGCFAYLGVEGGKQPLNLGHRLCRTKGVAIHELLHTIGFAHEHSRRDRDDYITVHYDNIPKRLWPQFEPLKFENDLGFGYDYCSVLHYGARAGSKNDKPTITTKDPKMQSAIGNRKGFSRQDADEVNRLYGCQGKVSLLGSDGCTDEATGKFCQVLLKLVPDLCKNPKFAKYANRCKKTCKKC